MEPANPVDESARKIERHRQGRGQEGGERQRLHGELQAVPLGIGDALGDFIQASPHGLPQQHDQRQQECREDPFAANFDSDDRDGL